MGSVLAQFERLGGTRLLCSPLQIGLGHHSHQGIETDLALPAQLLVGLAGITDEDVHLGRAVKGRVDADDDLPALAVDALALFVFTLPFQIEAGVSGGLLDKGAHRPGLAGGDDVIIGLLLLQHQPHGAHIVPGETPIPLGVQVAQLQHILQAAANACQGQGDLAGDELGAAQRGLVIE